jgi:tRNA A37 threonylcarbamoyladenosine biosynthesis protein TsaE
MNFTVHSLQDLDAVSDYLIQLSPSNTVFCFYGNLGAGKTTLIKLICEKLGVHRFHLFTNLPDYQRISFSERHHLPH